MASMASLDPEGRGPSDEPSVSLSTPFIPSACRITASVADGEDAHRAVLARAGRYVERRAQALGNEHANVAGHQITQSPRAMQHLGVG